MAIKLAFLKFKGGVSSSSAVSTIAGILKKDYRLLIIDCDPQNTQQTLLNVRGQSTRESSMAGILTRGYSAKKCLINVCKNLDLLQSGGKSIEEFNRKNDANFEGSVKLLNALKPMEKNYDYILLDASPTMSLIHQNIICYADYIILPCEMDNLSLSATRSTIHFVESLGSTLKRDGIKVASILGIVPMRFDGRRLVDDNTLEALYSLEDNRLLNGGTIFNTIRDSANMKTAQARRKFLHEVYPRGKLTEDYISLVKNIINCINKKSPKMMYEALVNTETPPNTVAVQ